MSRPLLVTDPGLAKLPMVADVIKLCSDAGMACVAYSSIQANPVGDNVMFGVATFQAGGHDGVIAFGGGSALDVGKAVGLMVGQARPLFDFEDREDWFMRVNVAGMAPVLAVPTTAGTGSEVGRASVITDTSGVGRPDHRGHRLRGGARLGDYGYFRSHQENHLPSADDAGCGHRGSRADRRPASQHHRRDRHGCAVA
jgi:hypothetical protein